MQKRQKQDHWYIKKYFPHFDSPLPFEEAKQLVESTTKITKHPFYPFLSRDDIGRRYQGWAKRSTKRRPIMWAAHQDGYIYSYYSWLLTELYEKRLTSLAITECVIAYRKGLGSTVDFSRQVFDEICNRPSCFAIALDISGFFDCIDHRNLKQEWLETLEVEALPPDHYAVFKSLTRWSKIDQNDCYKKLGFTQKSAPNRLFKDARQFREFVDQNSSIVQKNKNAWGIPQGSPMSAILSNLYMVPFDMAMKKLAENIGGYYRRYCDDILWICDSNHKDLVITHVDLELANRGANLFRKEEKTDISHFCIKGTLLTCDKPFQYLGFEFDGKKRLIRSKTLARYWAKAIRSCGAMRSSHKKNLKKGYTGPLWRKKINKKYTHLGRGNFVSYAYRAADQIGTSSGIKAQVRDHYERITAELNKPFSKRRIVKLS